MSIIQDFLRYNRQVILPEIGDDSEVKKATVLVIGAGGLGCPVLQYIAPAGVGTIGIVDFDLIEIHNLHRQILYTEDQVGLPKALQLSPS
jgi:adenylyltransferase/sulfurtransferase